MKGTVIFLLIAYYAFLAAIAAVIIKWGIDYYRDYHKGKIRNGR